MGWMGNTTRTCLIDSNRCLAEAANQRPFQAIRCSGRRGMQAAWSAAQRVQSLTVEITHVVGLAVLIAHSALRLLALLAVAHIVRAGEWRQVKHLRGADRSSL